MILNTIICATQARKKSHYSNHPKMGFTAFRYRNGLMASLPINCQIKKKKKVEKSAVNN